MAHLDSDGDGKITRAAVIDAITAMEPVNVAAIDEALANAAHSLWQRFDSTGSGYLDNVRAILEPGVVVDNPRMYPQGGGYCGSSFGVIGCLDLFTGPPQQLWNVIHFNWGLHDVCPLIKPNVTRDMHSTGGYTGITEKEYTNFNR